MRIKPTEFHLVPAQAGETLATAYGESWIRSNPGWSAQHEKATEMFKAFVTKNISEGKQHFLTYKHEIVLNLWHWKAIIYIHVLSKGKKLANITGVMPLRLCGREKNLKKLCYALHLGDNSNKRKPLFLKSQCIKRTVWGVFVSFLFLPAEWFWAIPEYLTIRHSSTKCEVIFFKCNTLR